MTHWTWFTPVTKRQTRKNIDITTKNKRSAFPYFMSLCCVAASLNLSLPLEFLAEKKKRLSPFCVEGLGRGTRIPDVIQIFGHFSVIS